MLLNIFVEKFIKFSFKNVSRRF